MADLTFLGAARTVTGSKYLLEHAGHRVLVDCGLFQGLKELRERNWADLPIPASSIHAVVLTHAHLDHVGYLPRLVAQGFKGRVFCTKGTADLSRLVLPDAGRIQEEDARQANKHGYTKHRPALPLYTESDALRALGLLQPVAYRKTIDVAPGVSVEFLPAGHLLGSAFVAATLSSRRRILFGGDLGRYARPVLPDPSDAVDADVVLVESTYGDRDHDEDDQGRALESIIHETERRGGKLIIPAFAIGRVEELLHWVRRLEREGRIPVQPVYLDSPMAVEALKHYVARASELDEEMRPTEKDVSMFATARFQAIATPQQSKVLTANRQPAIVISSSGMATGGRVLHHLVRALPDKANTVLFVGYQAAGTRGRSLVDGAERVKIHGQLVPVRARVAQLDSISAHAGRGEIIRWLGTLPRQPDRVCLVHGEPGPMHALATLIGARFAWRTHEPEHLERIPV